MRCRKVLLYYLFGLDLIPLQTSKHINHRGDTLNAPTITIEASSPAPGIALLTAYHWKKQVSAHQDPEYELFPDVDLNQIVSDLPRPR